MARRSSTAGTPPRPEVIALLEDAKENPEDDTPRLVLADWLEERGDPRGEFVRIQCRLARLGESDEAAELKQREAELLAKHKAEWLGPLGGEGFYTRFHRGLVGVWPRAHSLRGKRFPHPPLECLAWVDGLHIHDPIVETVTNLARSPHWTCLTCLDLTSGGYYSDEEVDHPPAGMGPQGGVTVASWPVLSRVTELNLMGNDIGAEGMAALAALSNLERLRILKLGYNNLRDEGAEALASTRSMTNLTVLWLARNRMTARGIAALAPWPGLSHLTTLDLFGNYPGAEGTAALAASPCLGRLTELNLEANNEDRVGPGPHQIGPEGAAALSRSTALMRLARLDLRGNMIGAEGAEALAASSTLTGLVDLNLSVNEIGDAGAVALASSPALAHLSRLDLAHNRIGDRGVFALAASPYLSALRSLIIHPNPDIGNGAFEALQGRFGKSVVPDNPPF
jgi:uncharacterized protein (TIGR02996 family)